MRIVRYTTYVGEYEWNSLIAAFIFKIDKDMYDHREQSVLICIKTIGIRKLDPIAPLWGSHSN